MKNSKPQKVNIRFISTALLAISGVALIGILQLLMSTVMAADVYELSSLKKEYGKLVVEAQMVSEEVYKLNQLNNVEIKASRMGMIPSDNTKYLYLED